MFSGVFFVASFAVSIVLFCALTALARFYQKVDQATAIVRNGVGGTTVSFSGLLVLPVVHRAERLDISVKNIEVHRHGAQGLICKDNIRADIKVVFFVRVNKTPQDVLQVSQLLGCARASEESALVELFDAKFSEALKTVGKQFDFTDLYNSREKFKDQILRAIGTDLNGYVLDDAAIDYLEQTPMSALNPDNILDAEGIKKITDLTSRQQMQANAIRREREKVITQQDVQAQEAILELERQRAGAQAKADREIAEVRAREQAQAAIVAQAERQKSEAARIAAEQEILVAEENKNRQLVVAQKSRQRTEAIEGERVEKDRQLEATERERIVQLAQIERDKAIEIERRNIQGVVRERVQVERAVVEEQEKIADAKSLASAQRDKQVVLITAQAIAEEEMLKQVKAAEAERIVSAQRAELRIAHAEAERLVADKQREAKLKLAEAMASEAAAPGLAEARVMEAKAAASLAQAKAEAEGIESKAAAVKIYDEVGRAHEEFRLRLAAEKEIELATLEAQTATAAAHARVMAEALKNAKIEVIGGDMQVFNRIAEATSAGKAVDRFVNSSTVVQEVARSLTGKDGGVLAGKIRRLMAHVGIGDAAKEQTVGSLLTRLSERAKDATVKRELDGFVGRVRQAGLLDTRLIDLSEDVEKAA